MKNVRTTVCAKIHELANLNITIDKKITCRIGVRFVDNLLDELGCLLTPDTIKNKLNLNCNYVEIYSIISAYLSLGKHP